jgi:lactate dehydrogenase-like 2-hydroxyacid dehydrogenase
MSRRFSDFRLLIPLPLPPDGLRRLTESFDALKLWEAEDPASALARAAPMARGVATTSPQKVDAAFLDRFPRLEIVANFGVGYDHIDVEAARARGVTVTHTPGVLTDEVADLAMGLMLCAVRQLPQADAFLRRANGSGVLSPSRLRSRAVFWASSDLARSARPSRGGRRLSGCESPTIIVGGRKTFLIFTPPPRWSWRA